MAPVSLGRKGGRKKKKKEPGIQSLLPCSYRAARAGRRALADAPARFMAALTMTRVARISRSSRGTTPGRAAAGAYATPLGATTSLARSRRQERWAWRRVRGLGWLNDAHGQALE